MYVTWQLNKTAYAIGGNMDDFHKNRIEEQFYISPDGKIHKYKLGINNIKNSLSVHYEIAKSLYPNLEYPDDYLYNLNWIIVGSYAHGLRIKNEPSQAQINTLNKHGMFGIRDSAGNYYEAM